MVTSPVSVEDDGLDARCLDFFADLFSEEFRARLVGSHFLSAEIALRRGTRDERASRLIVYGLRVDVQIGEFDAQARAGGGACDFFANSPAAFLGEFKF
jgi:hypothetical protein